MATSKDILLHEYSLSPFAEKIRLLLGYSGLSWYSVDIPVIMPKPDVTALTGGYRKTPLLQIGADVFCDSKLIASVIESLSGIPPLEPKEVAASAHALSTWADTTLFGIAVGYLFQPKGFDVFFAGAPSSVVTAFQTDRASFLRDLYKPSPIEAEALLRYHLPNLDNQLVGKSYLLGTSHPTIADFSVYHNIWFMKSVPVLGAPVLDSLTNLNQWYDRMTAIGHGKRLGKIDGKEAVRLAHDSEPGTTKLWPYDDKFSETCGIRKSSQVTVNATDYGTEPSHGELVSAGVNHIAIRRVDERAGTVHVHFPRVGFKVTQVAPHP